MTITFNLVLRVRLYVHQHTAARHRCLSSAAGEASRSGPTGYLSCARATGTLPRATGSRESKRGPHFSELGEEFDDEAGGLHFVDADEVVLPGSTQTVASAGL